MNNMASFYNFIDSWEAYNYLKESDELSKEIELETNEKNKERLRKEKRKYSKLRKEGEEVLKNLKRDIRDLNRLKRKYIVNSSIIDAIRDFNKRGYGNNNTLMFFNKSKFKGKSRMMSRKVYNTIKKNKDILVKKYYSDEEYRLEEIVNDYVDNSDLHFKEDLKYAIDNIAFLEQNDYMYDTTIIGDFNKIRAKLDNLDSLITFDNEEYFERKKQIESMRLSFVGFPSLNKKFIKLDNICSEVLNISIEKEYNKQLMQVARDCGCIDLEIYDWLQNHNSNLRAKLNKKNLKAIEMYNSLNIQNENILKLERLYDDLIKLSSANLDDDNIMLEFDTRYNEMKSILNMNPDLNIKKYSEFIKNYSNYIKKKNKEEKNISTSNPNLAKRKDYYSSYMYAKVTDEYVQKIPFSEYLKRTVPFEEELIEMEENREENARTIFKEYLKYYTFSHKSKNLTFKEFAKKNYFDELADVPIESEAVYKGMTI